MVFSTAQRNAICLLIGLLLLALASSRSEWFWKLGWPGAWLYNLAITLGWLLVAYFSSRLLGMRGLVGVAILGLIEAMLFAVLWWIIAAQPQDMPKPILYFTQSLYQDQHHSLQYSANLSHYDSQLGYRYRPGVESSFSNWEFGPDVYKINALGVRDDEASAQNPSIIVLGDSYTTGWGVKQDETFASRLESSLNVKVLNAGVSSYGTVREGLLLKNLPRDSCKLVIIQYCPNDFEENEVWADKMLDGAQFRPTFGQSTYQQKQVRNEGMWVYVPFKCVFECSKKALKFLLLPSNRHDALTMVQHPKPQEQVRYFFQGIRLIRQFYHGKILVISISTDLTEDASFIAVARKQALEDSLSGVHFIRTDDCLLPEDRYLIDGHYKASGHLKIARRLGTFIEQNDLLPPNH